jgi:hypothetical protein
VVELLGGEAAYRAAQGTESVYAGVLQDNPGGGSAARWHAYRLACTGPDDKPFVLALYAPGKAHLLAGQVGQRVRVVGKLVEARADGHVYRELWPARLEPLTTKLPDEPGADGVYARCWWQPAAALRWGARHYVFHDGQQLARAMGLAGDSAGEKAAALLAERLHVPAIDWKRHMVVSVPAGLTGAEAERLLIPRVRVQGRTLTVYYRLLGRPGGTPGFGYPAETVLVKRFDGTVRVEKESAPAAQSPPGK